VVGDMPPLHMKKPG